MKKSPVTDGFTSVFSQTLKKKLTPFTSTWMGLEEIMLSEISQAEKVNYHMVSLICGT